MESLNMNGNGNKDILVFGRGWIGSRISEYLSCDSSDKRIATYEDIQEEIDRYKPKALINCIGSFGRNVDDCEINKTKTLTAHTVVPLLLAEACLRNNLKLVHISSGCMFNYTYGKDSPISEDRTPDFHNLYYSRTKEYTEAALNALGDSVNILIVRPRMPLDCVPHPRNLLDKLVNFRTVIDLPNSVTYVPDFLAAIKHLLKIDATGIYNTVNYGGLKFQEILEEYRKYYPNHQYAITSQSELKMIRTNLILSTDKLEESGFEVRDIHDILYECVDEWVRMRKLNEGQGKSQSKEPGVVSNYPTAVERPSISQ
jgi:dTDP-4-dehydrorhamnose reductase